jgi:hypothetical protein
MVAILIVDALAGLLVFTLGCLAIDPPVLILLHSGAVIIVAWAAKRATRARYKLLVADSILLMLLPISGLISSFVGNYGLEILGALVITGGSSLVAGVVGTVTLIVGSHLRRRDLRQDHDGQNT